MNQINEIIPTKTDKKKKPFWWWFMAISTRLILPLFVIAAGVLYANHLIETSPKSKRQRPARQARLVEVVNIRRGNFATEVKAMGTVIPARSVDLKPQVSGKIVQINPKLIPGGLFQAGRNLMKIDPADYELQVRQRESDVATAQSNLKLEQGNQAVARQEYKLLDDVIGDEDKELVLRKPQLISLRSKLRAAEAQLKQEKLNLERTNITAPFNTIVKEKYVELGATVSPTTTLVTLTGTDEYWVELLVPVDQLKWIKIPRKNPETGSLLRIYNSSVWTDGSYREGRVLCLSSDLETGGRMAKLLVSVKDPLALTSNNADTESLLIGSYISAVIEGKTVQSVVKLNREFLRDGNNVWLYTTDNTLKIQPVKVVFRAEDYVLIANGITPEDQLIVTDIAAAVEGMPLRLPDQNPRRPETPENHRPEDKK